MKKTTTEQFISKANLKHNSIYDYSETVFISSHVKIKIVCKKHGTFEQTPSSHLSGRGCPTCGGRQQYGSDHFISMAKNKHGDVFDYSFCNYVNNKSPVTIICPTHGPFEQNARSHLNGRGCGQCHQETLVTDTNSFIKKAQIKHLNWYDYSRVVYTKSSEKVTITCPVHGEFRQRPNDHLTGRGCTICGLDKLKGAYNETFFVKFPDLKTKNSILYVVHFEHKETKESFYKIGITTLDSISSRFNSNREYKISSIEQKTMPLYEAYLVEQSLIRNNKQYSYVPSVFKGGHTECFTIPLRLSL